MTPQRYLFIFLLALPVLVAVFELGWLITALLVLVWLVARWLVTLSGLSPAGADQLHLDSIAVSHYVEKVRWCLDVAEIPYTEHQSVGTLGAFFAGRSVPRLRVKTGISTTTIGNSAEILRYLWGNYAHEEPDLRAFLEPTTERIELEKKLDKYGSQLQVWVYFHLLKNPLQLSRAWGIYDPNLSAWQRLVAKVAAPVLRRLIARAFRVNERSVDIARSRITELLTFTENRLTQTPYLVGSTRSYVDYAFAGLSGLWLQPEQFGNGKTQNVRLPTEDLPQGYLDDVNTWRKQFPQTVSFLEDLYQNERLTDNAGD